MSENPSDAQYDINLGAGALASPLISTQFAQMHRWSFHYLVSLGMSISGTILMVVVFKLRDHDGKHIRSVSSYLAHTFRGKTAWHLLAKDR